MPLQMGPFYGSTAAGWILKEEMIPALESLLQAEPEEEVRRMANAALKCLAAVALLRQRSRDPIPQLALRPRVLVPGE